MSDTFLCDDKQLLVGFLYDELDDADRRRMEDHLRICGACAVELESLRGVRGELAGWVPPEKQLGLALEGVTPAVSGVVKPARWWQPATLPVWARAAAAMLVVGAGLGLANIQVRYGTEGLIVTTGWMSPAPAPQAAPAAAPADDWRPALAALESSLRQTIAERTAPALVTASPRSSDVTLQRISELIDQSERRQRRELAVRLTQFGRDLEVQRRSDLVRINQGLGQFEGRAGAEIQRQRQMLDYIMRVSAQPPPQ